jgi:2-polyprenyl-3-methyl-5-hydroxy-6-metoxy-1,4-benzoquinol methylase
VVGNGRGEMLSCMKDWGYENYLGIDISPSTIDFCKSLDLPCELVEDSTAYLTANPDSCDVITLLDVLEHIPKQEIIPFLKALRSALKPGGVLIVQVPNLQAPDGHLHRYNDITHEVGFIEHSLAQVLLAAGFKKFQFAGYEDFVFGRRLDYQKKMFRRLHWLMVRFWRRTNGNLDPKILNPVFSAIVWKD